MRVKRSENLALIDKDLEVWGLEAEEVVLTLLGSIAVTLPLALITPLLLSLFPVLWLISLLKAKNYKDEKRARGTTLRKIYSFVEQKVLKRKLYYV